MGQGPPHRVHNPQVAACLGHGGLTVSAIWTSLYHDLPLIQGGRTFPLSGLPPAHSQPRIRHASFFQGTESTVWPLPHTHSLPSPGFHRPALGSIVLHWFYSASYAQWFSHFLFHNRTWLNQQQLTCLCWEVQKFTIWHKCLSNPPFKADDI